MNFLLGEQYIFDIDAPASLHAPAPIDTVLSPFSTYEPLTVPVELVSHQRAERDTGIQWLISEILSVAQQEFGVN